MTQLQLQKVKATTGVETPEVTGLTNKTWVPGQTTTSIWSCSNWRSIESSYDQVAANKDNITKNAGDIKTIKIISIKIQQQSLVRFP